MAKKILIIDDEEKIHESIGAILKDNGFEISNCVNPLTCFDIVDKHKFDLVLLDIWMPNLDGIQVLKRLKKDQPELSVIVVSGHANLANNFELAKFGAADFLEKPFSSDTLLQRVNKVFHIENHLDQSRKGHNKISTSLLKGIDNRQRTITKSNVLKGKGLHSGSHTGIILSPSTVDSGILFEDISSGEIIPLQIDNVDSTSYSTNLKVNDFSLSVVEHLLATLHIYGINNISIKVNNEIPILDGSALAFCKLIEESGLTDQDKNKKILKIDKKYTYVDPQDSTKVISIEPYNGLYVDYTFELPTFGTQHFEGDFSNNNIDHFKKEIAPARTFGFMEELKDLQSAGLGQGGDMENFLLVDEDKVLNQNLRFEDEFVRHKVLDILGDMMLLGYEIQGKILGRKTGHRHNIGLLKTIINES